MYIELGYEFMTYGRKLSNWEFQYIRHLDLQKEADDEHETE